MICCKEIDEYIKFVEENPEETDEESIAFVLRFAGVKRTSHADFIFDCQTDESASAGEAAEGQRL